jgi:hypothetical protein
LVIAAVVFLILREVVCWYWKINEIVSLQKQIVELLKGRQAAPEESAWRNLAAAAAIPAPAAPPPPVAGKKCSNCGYAVGENEAYCPNCGRSTA